MNFSKDVAKHYDKEFKGYFLIDVQKWYDEVRRLNDDKSSKPLTNQNKVSLAKFVINDVCSTYTSNTTAVVPSHKDHCYAECFGQPFVIDEFTDVIPQQESDNWFHRISIKRIDSLLVSKSINVADLRANVGIKFVNRDLTTPALNDIVKLYPSLIGKVVVPSRTGSVGLIEACITRVSLAFKIPKAVRPIYYIGYD
jgi:hypothetical protein